MSEDKHAGHSKPYKKYLYLNKFVEYQEQTNTRILELEKKMSNLISLYIASTTILLFAIAMIYL